MKNAEIMERVNILNTVNDILFETDKINVFDCFEKDAIENLFAMFHFHFDGLNIKGLSNSDLKTFRITVENCKRLCVNNAYLTEDIKAKYKEQITIPKKATANYFYIAYTMETLAETVKDLRNAFYERLSNICLEKNIGLTIKQEKKKATKKAQASASKKKAKATK